MKIAPLALLTIFAASSSAFGLNGGAQSVARATKSVAAATFKKPALVQPVDVHGNRLSTSVSSTKQKSGGIVLVRSRSIPFRESIPSTMKLLIVIVVVVMTTIGMLIIEVTSARKDSHWRDSVSRKIARCVSTTNLVGKGIGTISGRYFCFSNFQISSVFPGTS
jgi:hypothetical protein